MHDGKCTCRWSKKHGKCTTETTDRARNRPSNSSNNRATVQTIHQSISQEIKKPIKKSIKQSNNPPNNATDQATDQSVRAIDQATEQPLWMKTRITGTESKIHPPGNCNEAFSLVIIFYLKILSSKYATSDWLPKFLNQSNPSLVSTFCPGFDWPSSRQANRIWEFTMSSNQMRVPEGAADRRFLRFLFWIWKEIAPPALTNRYVPVHYRYSTVIIKIKSVSN